MNCVQMYVYTYFVARYFSIYAYHNYVHDISYFALL